MADDVQSALDAMVAIEMFRRRTQARTITMADIEQTSAGITKLSGQVMLDGPGEGRFPITFPISFSEKPLLSFGGELKIGTEPVPGNFPTVSVVVGKWITTQVPPFQLNYTGCDLLIVTTGHVAQRMFIHWHLEGMAYNNTTDDSPPGVQL